MNGFVEINEDLETLGRPETLLIYTSSRELEIQWTGWVVHKRTIHPPSSKPSLWSRPDFQLPVMPLSNYLDPISQTLCGYQPTNSGLRDREELHSSAALPPTFWEPGPHLQNEPVAQMIPKISSNSESLCPFCETPQTWEDSDSHHCFLPPGLQSYTTCTRPISWVIVPEYKLIPN